MIKHRMKEILRDKNMTPYALHKTASITLSTAYGLEKDPERQISLVVLNKICTALQLPVEEIIYNDPPIGREQPNKESKTGKNTV